jgi:1,4-dihydroxy-2-naphthoate polyprenyltransferase
MLKKIYQVIRPLFLVFTALTYSLGAGIAHYLGGVVNPASFVSGLVSALALLCSTFLFSEYFRLSLAPLQDGETFKDRNQFKVRLLQISFALVTFSVICLTPLLVIRPFSSSAGVIFVLMVFAVIVYAVPPVQLNNRGYGELILAGTLGYLLPAFGMLLQYSQVHRLLSFAAIPVTLLSLSYFLACDFPNYARDLAQGHHSILLRLTWQIAVPVHHIVILLAFLSLAVAPLLGIPWKLTGPSLLALPVAILQMVRLQISATGGKPMWRLFTAMAGTTLGLATYFLTITFWIR